jgi:predicted alpha/beta superfamily hydrolase
VIPNAYSTEINALDLAGPRTAPPPPVGSGAGGGTNYDASVRDIVGDLVPFVDKHFRTLTNRDNRALAGLSMGAGITTNVALMGDRNGRTWESSSDSIRRDQSILCGSARIGNGKRPSVRECLNSQ